MLQNIHDLFNKNNNIRETDKNKLTMFGFMYVCVGKKQKNSYCRSVTVQEKKQKC